ncbi:metallophosphoesterase [Palaeococcus sp. (in: euryarchaeotes)]|uniref:metallophosphoesterase n=1 Tax=Palaeococcus sp. (in: euryarchaeotes) TaxID=2820298 RepID=UPI0025D17514|nr:metallophosphoesterase [Palaeococcus sp. (in: euryarchaeotes)]MCD6558755.1 metallophosphoesterase [Palaeococcus sp. (in: euryarchaeotes)]
MKIGIIGDTHYPDKTSYLPDLIFDVFEKEHVELILHTGDLTSPDLKRVFEELAPTFVVRGNLDRAFFPEEKILELEGLKVGIIHGHQFLSLDSQTLKYKALEMGIDLLIFGHTHRFYYEEIEFNNQRIILLNPGSPTVPRRSDPTFLIGEIHGRKFKFKIFKPWETQWKYP